MGTHPIFESDFDCLTASKMTLESTVICVDNSEYCRNGDYAPTRLLAQRDAINMVARAKLRQNAENTCALLTMANNGLAATLTNAPRCTSDEYGRWCRSHGWWSING